MYVLSNGLKESVQETNKGREANIRRASFKIMNIVKDCRAQRVGGFLMALILWERCAIPSLSDNCSTWLEIVPQEKKLLAEQQDFFLRAPWHPWGRLEQTPGR